MAYTSPRLTGPEAQEVIDLLQSRLASYIDLSLTLKHIHWNVVGPSFIAVHEMLDPQYQAVADMVDDTAERIATLGGEPLGTPGSVVERRSWDDYSLNRAEVQAHLGALDVVYEGIIGELGEAIDRIGEIDAVTEGLLVDQATQLEQFHWFVRAHLEDAGGRLSTEGASTEQQAAAQATKGAKGAGGTSGRSGKAGKATKAGGEVRGKASATRSRAGTRKR